MTALPARGEIWWCEMAEIGQRPVVVLSRDAVIPRHRRALIAPCTTTIRRLVSEVVLKPGNDPLPRRSAINLDSVESVSLAILVDRLGRRSDAPGLRRPRGRRRLHELSTAALRPRTRDECVEPNAYPRSACVAYAANRG